MHESTDEELSQGPTARERMAQLEAEGYKPITARERMAQIEAERGTRRRMSRGEDVNEELIPEEKSSSGRRMAATREQRIARQKRETRAARGMVEAVRREAARIGADIKVVESEEDIPANDPDHDQLAAQVAGGELHGLYDDETDTVWIVAPNLKSTEHGIRVLWHEAVAHQGLGSLLGERFAPTCRAVFRSMDAEARGAEARASYEEMGRVEVERILGKEAPEKYDELSPEQLARYLSDEKAQAYIGDEHMANTSEGGWGMSVVEVVNSALRRLARSLGFDLRYTDADIRDLLRRSARAMRAKRRRSLKRGKGRSVAFTARAERDGRNAIRQADTQAGSIVENLARQAARAWNDKSSKGKTVVPISGRAAERFGQLLGHPITELVVTDDAVRHIKNQHGDSRKETLRGQEAITAEDIATIPYIIDHYDTMELDAEHDDAKGNKAIKVSKRINGTSIVATIEKGRDKEFVVTSWRHRKSDALDAQRTPGPNVRNDSDLAKVQKEIAEIKETARKAVNTGANGRFRLRRGVPSYDRALARENYERRVRSGWFQSAEAVQDSMRGLLEAYRAVFEAATFRNALESQGMIPKVCENPRSGKGRARPLLRPLHL